MNERKRVAVIGYGQVGRGCVEALGASTDFELAGIVRRSPAAIAELPGVPVVGDVADLGQVAGALLACPTRQVEQVAKGILARGIATSDSFDIHGEALTSLRRTLDGAAKAGGTQAVISAGWDPGVDSMVRAIVEHLAPRGLTFTNFGPGMSMGHSVAARAIPGVKNAISLTLPKGAGQHRRLVYVELQPGATLEAVSAALRADAYFAKDETQVVAVEDVSVIADAGHGVLLERKGISGETHNQYFRWEMRIQNPALTGQAMLSALRAAMRQAPGCYTPIELPLVDFLPGEREAWVGKLM